jgi:hypothetical protein
MSRRIALLALLTFASAAIACADSPTSPDQKSPSAARQDCRSGYTTSSGIVCTDSSGI